MLEAKDASDLIQIDHTLANVIVVGSRYRKPIGRPGSRSRSMSRRDAHWAFISRSKGPSALAVAQCLEHACLPKNRANALSEGDAPWPMFGLPQSILVDNGSEFHGAALVRDCSEYGITLSHRPVARPHFGGHIERLIGTLMGRVHLLPGTMDASPAARGGYDSEGEARLTLDEFREWLALKIAGRYHHSIHRILGTTPAAAWADSISIEI